MATSPEEISKVWQMLAKIDICMFVTDGPEGRRGRPMSTIPQEDSGVIYLLTEASSAAALDVAAHGDVLLSYQGGGDHVAVTGDAKVHGDAGLIKRLWSPGAQAFWPDGPEAANVVAIAVTPAKADYWDGPNPVVGAAKFLFGLATGKQPDLGERGAVAL